MLRNSLKMDWNYYMSYFVILSIGIFVHFEIVLKMPAFYNTGNREDNHDKTTLILTYSLYFLNIYHDGVLYFICSITVSAGTTINGGSNVKRPRRYSFLYFSSVKDGSRI